MKGPSAGVYIKTSSRSPSSLASVFSNRNQISGSGGTETPYETGGGGGPSLSSTEEISHIPTRVKSEAIQSFHSIPSFQDAGLEHSNRLVTTRDVDVQAGHEGCLFLCECSTGTQTVPEICVAGENIPVPLPPVRVGVLAENIHKAIKASDGDTAACGNESSNLPGHFIYERVQAGSAEQSRHSHLASNISRVCDKHGISRFFNRFTRALLSPTQESCGHQNKLCDVAQQRVNSEVVTVRDVAKVTGRLTACAAAVFSAPLHYRHLQMVKTRTLLANHSYEAPLTLSPGAKQELRLWSLHLETWNGKS